MSSILDGGIFTKELVNENLTLTESFGVRMISVYNASAVIGTVTGQQKLGGTVPTAINLAQGETFSVEALEGSVIKNLAIVSPAGCTLKVVALV